MTDEDLYGALTVGQAAIALDLSVPQTRSLISSKELRSTLAGSRRMVPLTAIAGFHAGREARASELRATSPTDWDWEGNVVNTLRRWLVADGWRVLSQADTALRSHGVDLIVEKEGNTQHIEVKGWPSRFVRSGPNEGRPVRAPHAMARNYVGDLVLSALLLRADHPNDQIAIAVPEHATFTTLLETIGGALDELGIAAYVISETGSVAIRDSRARSA